MCRNVASFHCGIIWLLNLSWGEREGERKERERGRRVSVSASSAKISCLEPLRHKLCDPLILQRSNVFILRWECVHWRCVTFENDEKWAETRYLLTACVSLFITCQTSHPSLWKNDPTRGGWNYLRPPVHLQTHSVSNLYPALITIFLITKINQIRPVTVSFEITTERRS